MPGRTEAKVQESGVGHVLYQSSDAPEVKHTSLSLPRVSPRPAVQRARQFLIDVETLGERQEAGTQWNNGKEGEACSTSVVVALAASARWQAVN